VSEDNAATRIAERCQQWQILPAEERIRRVHSAAADVAAYARRRRAYLRPRSRTNDFLFIKERAT
jgi:hypothetical protein